jgi:hypothetical protein
MKSLAIRPKLCLKLCSKLLWGLKIKKRTCINSNIAEYKKCNKNYSDPDSLLETAIYRLAKIKKMIKINYNSKTQQKIRKINKQKIRKINKQKIREINKQKIRKINKQKHRKMKENGF